MKNKFVLLIGFLLTAVTHNNAQVSPSPAVKKMDVCELFISNGIHVQPSQYTSIADYRKLAPESQLLKADLSNFTKTQSFGASVGGMFSVLMGIRFGKKDRSDYRPNPIFRVGISYFYTGNLSTDLYQSQSKRIDTLSSSQTGQTYFIDSVITRNYSINYSSQQVRLDLSLIYRTDGKARWSFYSGFGINAGASISAFTNVNYYNYPIVQSNNQYYYPSTSAGYSPYPQGNFYYNGFAPSGTTIATEKFKNANNTALSAYIPLAVDFRMGKKKEFWKRLHLFLEFRPGINITNIPELGTFSTGYFQSNFGLKVNWEKI